MLTVLITGATGFLGSHLLKKIITETTYNVIVLKRSFSNIFRIEKLLKNPRIKYYNIDQVMLEQIFHENKLNIIIHCATNYGKLNTSCFDVLETNLMFPIQLLEIAIKNGTEIFINTDSYFNKENMSYSYLLNYSLSKKSLILWLKYFASEIKIINLVLEHIYGEYDNKTKFVEYAIQKIAIEQIKDFEMTSGHQKRDFIYIDDVCNSYLAAINYALLKSFRYKTFDIGTGTVTSIQDFVNNIKRISNSKTHLLTGVIPYRNDEIMYSAADLVELSDLKLPKPKTVIDGLTKIINTYLSDII